VSCEGYKPGAQESAVAVPAWAKDIMAKQPKKRKRHLPWRRVALSLYASGSN